MLLREEEEADRRRAGDETFFGIECTDDERGNGDDGGIKFPEGDKREEDEEDRV